MNIIATTNEQQSTFPQVPTGVHKARCVNVIDLGTQENNYDGNVTYKRQCMIIWEVPAHKNDMNGEPLTLSKFYTLSLHEKSNLGADLSAWRGRAFTETEKKGFDITKLLGVPCYLNIMEGKNGRPRVASIMPLPKEEAMDDQHHDSIMFSIDDYQKGDRDSFNQLSEGIRNIILRSKELSGSHDFGDANNGTDLPDFTDSDRVPF
ncbi:MAG: hypothetical protein Tp1100DCM1099271_16 [Prokaryotic dsDNA virus sp.]|nr:MAG: hypothetical protein Tp1102SUR405181_47 [Prokaryotic dsDNA virus sp.]QDP60044.1 MAG: hypothetical protein Tp1100DCM1099271_16 [Prokaryotic dsDNA virus sp.]QDP67112.1 MAG: hypothetical protein Tp1111SUR49671_32 [Prokaryotic dsDNA virus sp.]|tara:strand:- start:6118 stop:6735 length:618 start_codon:yes stop_codon:yes gene_type:complete